MRKKMVSLLMLMLGVLTVVCLYTSAKAYKFRSHPHPSQVKAFFGSTLPYMVPACLVVLKRGAPAYDHDLRAWLYKPGVVRNNPWNRWILLHDALRLKSKEIHLLAHYPLPPDPTLLPKIKEALWNGEWSVISLLRRMDNDAAKHLFREWIEQGLKGPANADSFLEALPYIVGWPSVPLTGLLQRFWPYLPEEKRSLALGTVARFMGKATPPADLIPFLDQAIKGRESELNGDGLALLGQLINRPATREEAFTLIEREGSRIPLEAVKNLVTCLPPEKENMKETDNSPGVAVFLTEACTVENAFLVFRRTAQTFPSIALEALETLAKVDIRKAEELAKPALAGADSELRKGVIVILIGGYSEIGSRFLDQAFEGAPPRSRRFTSIEDYIHGSKAEEEYIRIARHDYLEVGKQWPPFARDPLQWVEEAKVWPTFIAKYPWFPGTDDAYYRLAYAQYVAGGPDEAVATVLRYFRGLGRSTPDGDAEPYMQFLVRIIAYANPTLPDHSELFSKIHALLAHPPGLFLLEESPELESYLASIEWFRSREIERRVIGVSVEDLNDLQRLAEVARMPYGVARLVQAGKILQERTSAIPDLLYGRFSWLGDVSREKEIVEFSDDSMRYVTGQLTVQLAQSKSDGQVELCLALSRWLMMHKESFDNYSAENFNGKIFSPLLEQVEQAQSAGNLCPKDRVLPQ